MKHYSREFVLGDLSEAEFQNWKHHPVTKLMLRFYRDYEKQLGANQVGQLRSSSEAPDLFKLGVWTGSINTMHDLANPEFETVAKFYTPEETEEDT